MRRKIVGFLQDEVGEWVADLSCLHRQHVRHRPPFQERTWVLDEAERAARISSDVECPLCNRAELPRELQVDRTAGPFDADSLPAGLRRDHRVGRGTWGLLRVVQGGAVIDIEVDPPIHVTLRAGEAHPIPPGVVHRVARVLDGVIEVDFLARDGP